MNRRRLLLKAIPAFATLGPGSSFLQNPNPSDETLLSEAAFLSEIDNDSFNWIWGILKGISDDELDWKINEKANTIRWIVGHLNWFEEWSCDAIEETGIYLIREQPTTSFQSDNYEEMKTRFSNAREKYKALTDNITPEQMRRSAEYLYNDYDNKRAQIDLRTILAIHSTHFYGHLYQIRMIRGTYSRVNDTDKSKFDKW